MGELLGSKGVSALDEKTDASLNTKVQAYRTPITVLVTGYGPFLEKYPINSSWSIASSLPAHIPASAGLPVPINIVVPDKPFRVSFSHVAATVPKLLSGTYVPTLPAGHGPLSYPTSAAGATLVAGAANQKKPLPKPDIVLHIGLAAGRKHYTLERQAPASAFNRTPDVDGQVLSDRERERLFEGLPKGVPLQPTFDTDDLLKRWRAYVEDPKADVRGSYDPGSYLCGFIYFFSLAWFWRKNKESEQKERSDEKREDDVVPPKGERPVAFLHVPDLPTSEGVTQGRDVAIGLVKALVASREERGIVEPMKPRGEQPHLRLDSAERRKAQVANQWDGGIEGNIRG